MTREEALAYLRFESELMAELQAKKRGLRRDLDQAKVPELLANWIEDTYGDAMKHVGEFNSMVAEKHGAWDAIRGESPVEDEKAAKLRKAAIDFRYAVVSNNVPEGGLCLDWDDSKRVLDSFDNIVDAAIESTFTK